ncbi:MAG: MspA family porin [Gordonia sp. (in: high G+C Gram-positive bacteria)]|uniref:MspA family porin n=1 Tax=Gordonia sp. (in: high G+C Gram-positive bacteria) TaxID=84139 RepID=UPI0039E4FE63
MSNVKKRVLSGAAVAGAALVGIAGITAGAAEAGKLPGATKTRSFDAGSVTIRLFDESYKITRAVTNVPTSREVFVSGKVRVTTSGDVKGGNIGVGYIVGCQLNFGASANGGAGVDIDNTDAITGAISSGTFTPATPSPSGGVGGGFSLSPGQAAYVPVIKANVGGNSVDSFNFGDATGGVAYSQERFGVDGCAGHAEAVAKVTVKVSTDEFKGNISMYGKPFSLG